MSEPVNTDEYVTLWNELKAQIELAEYDLNKQCDGVITASRRFRVNVRKIKKMVINILALSRRHTQQRKLELQAARAGKPPRQYLPKEKLFKKRADVDTVTAEPEMTETVTETNE